MKKLLLGLFLLCACFIQANAQKDSTITRSTLYGIGSTNILDTYLSPMEYTGHEIRVLREGMRMTNLWDGTSPDKLCFRPISHSRKTRQAREVKSPSSPTGTSPGTTSSASMRT